tara:strand:+ start:5080 stop:5364 length:285 start_codon:yes stop_codon:yes gene_type:complete
MINFISKIRYNFCYKLVISIITWILYLEINPKIRGIWIRPDSNNNKVLRLENIIPFIIKTLQIKEMWSLQFFDVNFILANLINIILFTIIENYI